MKKKILICSSSYRSLLNFRGKLIEEILKNNYEVVVSTPKIEEQEFKIKLSDLGIKVYENELVRNKYSILSDFSYIKKIYKIIKKERPDVFFAYTFKPVFYGSFLAKFFGVKSINSMMTGLGYNFISNSATSKIIRNIFKYSLSCNHEIIFQNEDDLQFLLDKKILSKNKSRNVVNGSGVDLTHYKIKEINLKRITFLMVGRLLKAKGVKEYYMASKIVKSKYPNVSFELLGDYEKESVDSISEELYEKIVTSKVINYIGRVKDVRKYIANASVLVLPSYREGTPRSVLEAMSIGRAIITTNTAGCRQTINQEKGKENGFLVPVRDHILLAKKIEEYILNNDLIINHGKNSRIYVEEKYDVNKVNKQMLKIFKIE